MEDLLTVCKPLIEAAEGLKLHLYKDTNGNLTVGYGHNLDAKGISRKIADQILEEDLNDAITECKNKFAFFNAIGLPRQYVLVNMAFNMGIGGLLSFVRMLNALAQGDYQEAARELENSLANKQVPNRVFPLIRIMETGKLEN